MLYRGPLISCIVLLTRCISQAAGATTAGLTNLGLGLDGAASASSRYSGTYAAAYAIDGALSTECRTRSEISPWFQVILEEDKLISVIRIFADYDMGLERATLDFYQEREFELVKRVAGSNFRRIYGEAIDDLPVEFAYEAVLDSPVTAKTLRLTYFGSYAEIRMTEFQIWGQPVVTPPPTGAPVGLPSAAPTKSPVPSASPSRSPSARPSFSPTIREEPIITAENDCDNLDDAYFFVNGVVQRDCEWLKGQTSSTIDDMCNSPSYPVSQVCFSTCSTCLSRRAQTTWDSTTPIEGCEDLEDVQFPVIFDTSGRTQNCAWLRGQPEDVMEAYCVSTSPAFHICEDTCGKCIDVCQDDNAVLLDPYNTSPQRPGRASTCSQLANLPREIGAACQVPQIRNACQDTCDSCSVVPTAAPSPAPSMDHSTPAPTTKAPTGSPSSSPSMDSASVAEIVTAEPAPTCDDDDDARFWVGLDVNQVQHCIWLAARPTYQAILCMDGHESGAYHSCAETCGKCSDTCEDIPGAVFDVDGATRNCVWLSIRPHKQDEVCFPGHPAWELCLESCDVCDFA